MSFLQSAMSFKEKSNLDSPGMKTTFITLLSIAVLAVILSACSYRNTDGTGDDSADANAEESSVTYQLAAIEGHTPPDGGFYELNDSTGRWCERPTAADIMAYSRMSDLENPDESPDLTNYFSDEHTRLFNSCRMVVRDLGQTLSLTLSYNGAVVYAGSVDKASIPAGGTYEFRVKSIKGFDLPEPEASLELTNGTDYVITCGAEPAMSFTNEFGEYFLKFRRVTESGQ